MGTRACRSKGCRTCRQRRVKCDEAQPECGQCLRLGRQCPGPFKGILFINVQPNAQGESAQPNQSRSPRETRSKSAFEPVQRLTRSRTSTAKSNSSEKSPRSGKRSPQRPFTSSGSHATDAETLAHSMDEITQMELPSWYQPSKAEIFQQHYTAYFIGNWFNPSSFLNKLNLWVFHIPAISCSSPSRAVQYSIRATTMAFYGVKTGNLALQTEASHWYGRGMAEQRTELEHLSTHSDNQQLSFTGLLAPVMFSMFESVMVTSAAGSAQHLHAASRMLEILGPEACQDGVANSLFRSIRVAMIYVLLSWDTAPALASEAWCTIPYIHRPKTIVDVLDDILLQIPACYILRTRWRDLKAAFHPDADTVEAEVTTMAQELKSKLDCFWGYHGDHLLGLKAFDLSDMDNMFDDVPRSRSHAAEFSLPVEFPDVFSAEIIARYNAGCLLICGLLRCMDSAGYNNGAEMNAHGESILSAVDYHEQLGPSHSGCISMIFPLRSLIVQAKSEDQRKAAQRAIVTWGERRGVVKLCNLQSSRDTEDKRSMPFEIESPSPGFASPP
ncbi:MAG: hypothetical protein Q9212_005812 [Teloschistes hypoglaucus]